MWRACAPPLCWMPRRRIISWMAPRNGSRVECTLDKVWGILWIPCLNQETWRLYINQLGHRMDVHQPVRGVNPVFTSSKVQRSTLEMGGPEDNPNWREYFSPVQGVVVQAQLESQGKFALNFVWPCRLVRGGCLEPDRIYQLDRRGIVCLGLVAFSEWWPTPIHIPHATLKRNPGSLRSVWEIWILVVQRSRCFQNCVWHLFWESGYSQWADFPCNVITRDRPRFVGSRAFLFLKLPNRPSSTSWSTMQWW